MVVDAQGEQAREAPEIVRDDFWASMSNKQRDFVQHVRTLLKINGE
jgi:type I restriction enzyme M protein